MADSFNLYPQSAVKFGNLLKRFNKNPLSTNEADHFIVDTIEVNYRISGILTASSTTDDVVLNKGNKYILGVEFGNLDAGIQTLISDNWTPNSSEGASDVLDVNDIVVYDSGAGYFELVFDASNSAWGASGGALVYSINEAQFYGFTGGGWGPISSGTTGDKGNTGESIVFGSEYTHTATSGAVDAAGEIFVNNTLSSGIRPLYIHRNAGGFDGFAGASGDLNTVFFPYGTSDEDKIPTVTLFLYNNDIDKTFAARIKAKPAALSGSVFRFTSSSHYYSYEILRTDSGIGDWSNTWNANDDITLLVLADGVKGDDGVAGVTGQGITLSASSPVSGELEIQYINADGSLGDTALTGIVSGSDGVTGDPGEVGFEMYFTGGNLSDWTVQEYDYSVALTGDIPIGVGEIHYVSDYGDGTGVGIGATADYIIMSESATGGISQFTYMALGLTTGEYGTQTTYTRPGNLFFYEKEDYELKLRSFVSYEQVIPYSPNNVIVLKGINDNGASLGIGNGTLGFVLPVPEGLKGQGITFGTVIANELYLDYIDSDGNTFGRFNTGIKGITGNQGSLNPFNIPYAITGDSNGVTGTITVTSREAGTNKATAIRVSGISRLGDEYGVYLDNAEEVQRGYLTVFDANDVGSFGIFRYTGSLDDPGPGDNGQSFTIVHVGGDLSAIYDVQNTNGVTGLTANANALFALNFDGIQGQSGITGIGFTYGNEYFINDSLNRPLQRTNGDPFEIGDKWFCTDAGLEFTFLGATGYTGAVVFGASAGNNSRWGQANNARQGRRGPQGPEGPQGDKGDPGDPGLNHRGQWATSVVYVVNDSVKIDYSQLTESNRTNWTNYFGAGVTNAVFLSRVNHTSTLSNQPASAVSPFVSGNWAPLVSGAAGVQGPRGVTGTTGPGFRNPAVTNGGTFTVDLITTNQDGSETATGVTVGNILGPVGPTGPVGGSNKQFMYKDGNSANGTSNLVINDVGQIVIGAYKEKSNSASVSPSGVNASLSLSATDSSFYTLPLATPYGISEIILENFSDGGDAVSLLIDGLNGASFTADLGFYWDSASAENEITDVYISKQSAVTPTRMDYPQDNEAAIMTLRRWGSSLYINYVLMETYVSGG